MERRQKIFLFIAVALLVGAVAYFAYMAYTKKIVLDFGKKLASGASDTETGNLRAFLAMIRSVESGNRYNVIYGGQTFTGYSDHPRVKICAPIGGKTVCSDAAGAYQFLSSTWDDLKKRYGLPDFSPENQDTGAVALINERNALGDVKAGNFKTGVQKVSSIWASLPGNDYGQNPKTLAALFSVYTENGGVNQENLA